MAEIDWILDVWNDRRERAGSLLLATVVDVQGSTYRKPGAHMLVTGDGQRIGSISGGCLEGEVARKGWWWTEQGPVVRIFDTTSEDEDMPFGLGCSGRISILLERLNGQSGLLDALRCCRAARQTGLMATVLSTGERVFMGAGERYSSARSEQTEKILEMETLAGTTHRIYCDGLDIFIEAIEPPVPLLIFGTGRDVPPLLRLAKELGWHATVADEKSSIGEDSVAVVMNHSYPLDRSVVGRLLEKRQRYVGVLGPRRRTDRMLMDLGIHEVPEWLYAPIGLDLGAATPETIALSIVSEIQAALASKSGGMLRDVKGRRVECAKASEEVLYAVQ